MVKLKEALVVVIIVGVLFLVPYISAGQMMALQGNVKNSSGGDWSNFSADGVVSDLEVASHPENVNFSFMLISNTNLSYTPNVVGNITLTSWYEEAGDGGLPWCGEPPADVAVIG